jgi:hypothetical protein
MKRALLAVASVSMLAVGVLLAFSAVAQAHERRNVDVYTFVVGWVTEPAYQGQPNSIDLRVSRTADASPVTGLEQTLKAEVSQGSKKLNVTLRPRFQTPGAYNGYMTPTVEGVYAFHFTGSIEGKSVDQTFTSGPGTFGSIEAPVAFPEPLLSTKAVDESLRSLEERVVTLESDDSGGSGTAMAVGIAGVVVGVLGLGTAGFALTRIKS